MSKIWKFISVITVLVALVGMYKFNYLSGKKGYDVDGNKIEKKQKLTDKFTYTNKDGEVFWQAIQNQTWFSEKGFAGEQITFFEHEKVTKKVVCQLLGSGVYVVTSKVFEVILDDNQILFGKEKLTFDKDKNILTSTDNNTYKTLSKIVVYGKNQKEVALNDLIVKDLDF